MMPDTREPYGDDFELLIYLDGTAALSGRGLYASLDRIDPADISQEWWSIEELANYSGVPADEIVADFASDDVYTRARVYDLLLNYSPSDFIDYDSDYWNEHQLWR